MTGVPGAAFGVLAAGVLAMAAATAVSQGPGTRAVCNGDATDVAAVTTFCAPLVPTPDLRHVRAILTLRPAPSPFGVAVTAEGKLRQRITIAADGLPEPRTLGDYNDYVAWVTDLAVGGAVKLGPVTNGVTMHGETAENQFRVLVTAERNADVAERRGRVVLRGTSPSVRLLGHRDLLLSGSDAFGRPAAAHAAGHDGHGPRSASGWIEPPMDPAMPLMPGMHGREPRVDGFVPGAGRDTAAIPFAKPRSIRDLATGDTLELLASMVRRSIGAKTFVMYGFNGEHPGPLIRVEQGATIVVRFRNALELPTAVHWHGVRLENRFDGAVGVTQDPVPPGGAFEYRVHFRDAGIYWYHPHHREDIQQDLGLYGNLLVRSRDPDYLAPVHREEVVTLDDILVGEAGLVPHGAQAATHALMGRFGNVFLTNGEPRYTLTVNRGEVVRFHLTNVASARIFNVSFAGAAMKVVGSDLGRLEREERVENATLAPAERYSVDVLFARPGRVALVNRIQSIDHMLGGYTYTVDTLGIVTVVTARTRDDYAARFGQERRNEDVARELSPLRAHFARPVDHELHLRLDVTGLPAGVLSSMGMSWAPPFDFNDGMPMMNWLTTVHEVRWVLRDAKSGSDNMDIDWRFRVGDIVKIRVVNREDAFHAMSHPIHVHGQRFLVLSRNGAANENLAWKDTAVIGVGETVDILLELSNPGRWMLHCHIAEHLGAGMHTVFTVGP